jgi:formyltetrahydrofolate synthetase
VIRNDAEISSDARQMIQTAASRAGMTVAEWLNAVILDAAADEGVELARYVFKEPAKRKKADLTLLYSRLDDLAEKVELLAQTNLGSPPADERSKRAASFDGPQHVTFRQLSELAHTTSVQPSLARAHRRMAASR